MFSRFYQSRQFMFAKSNKNFANLDTQNLLDKQSYKMFDTNLKLASDYKLIIPYITLFNIQSKNLINGSLNNRHITKHEQDEFTRTKSLLVKILQDSDVETKKILADKHHIHVFNDHITIHTFSPSIHLFMENE